MVSTIIDSLVQSQENNDVKPKPLLWNSTSEDPNMLPTMRNLEDSLAYFFEWTGKNLKMLKNRNKSAGTVLKDEVNLLYPIPIPLLK